MFQVGIDSLKKVKLAKRTKETMQGRNLQPRPQECTTQEDDPDDDGEGEEDGDEDSGELAEEVQELAGTRAVGAMRIVDGELMIDYESDSENRGVGGDDEEGVDTDEEASDTDSD